jgi:uncharacterized protein YjbI with pentapeptide repeats
MDTKEALRSSPGKTAWDWLDLLTKIAIPLVIVGATILIGMQQANLAQQQRVNEQTMANQQHEADQQQALDQQQATTLQTYIDNIQDLLLNHNLRKADASVDANPYRDVAVLARARTLTALQGLDAGRKGRLLIFLYEAQLIGFFNSQGKLIVPVIVLAGADLAGANLTGANLAGANLTGANLADANLAYANLNGASLLGAGLAGASLAGATLTGTNLYQATLTGANLYQATLTGANLFGADLRNVENLTQQQLDLVLLCARAMLPPGVTCHRTQ